MVAFHYNTTSYSEAIEYLGYLLAHSTLQRDKLLKLAFEINKHCWLGRYPTLSLAFATVINFHLDALGTAAAIGSMELVLYILDRLESEPVSSVCGPLSVVYKGYVVIAACSSMFLVQHLDGTIEHARYAKLSVVELLVNR